MRYSKQRESILQVLRGTTVHPDAVWIYEQVRGRYIPNISLGTVYRNLKSLVDSGDVLAIKAGDRLLYDGDTSAHYHYVCKGCGRVYDLSLQLDLPQQLQEQTGYSCDNFSLVFFGNCPTCNK